MNESHQVTCVRWKLINLADSKKDSLRMAYMLAMCLPKQTSLMAGLHTCQYRFIFNLNNTINNI